MKNVTAILDNRNIRHTNSIFAVADTATLISESSSPVHTASKLFAEVLMVDIKFEDAIFARMAAKHMIRDIVVSGCIVDPDDIDIMVEQALAYATQFCDNPDNSYLWSKPDVEGSSEPQQVTVIEGIEVQVAVNDNGKIKKGGKALLAAELYQTNVLDAEVPLTNIEFVAMLMEKLDMTKAGAVTYGYNCRKAHALSLQV